MTKSILLGSILSSVLFAGCGAQPGNLTKDKRKYTSTNPEFYSYLEAWSDAGNAHGKLGFEWPMDVIPVNFDASISGQAKAECIRDWTDFWPLSEILVNEEYWINASEFERTALIYHEMGHCFKIIKGHDNRTNGAGKPLSFMGSEPMTMALAPCETEYIEAFWTGNETNLNTCLNGLP